MTTAQEQPTVQEKLKGVFLPITTPFNADMTVDYEGLLTNIKYYRQSGVHGYLALGSNGENRCLTELEKRHVVEYITSPQKAPEQIVMIGCMYDSVFQTVFFYRSIRRFNPDFITLLTPNYFKKQMTQLTLRKFFTECADEIETPILLYNAPGFTGVTIEPDTVAALAQHPNIKGMKDSAPGGIENLCHLNSPEFSVMAGSASTFYPSMSLGVQGAVISLGNVDPKVGLTLWNNGLRGQNEEGLEYHRRMKIANSKISGTYGVAGVKAAMDLVGLAGGYPRSPLERLEGSDREAVRDALKEAGILP